MKLWSETKRNNLWITLEFWSFKNFDIVCWVCSYELCELDWHCIRASNLGNFRRKSTSVHQVLKIVKRNLALHYRFFFVKVQREYDKSIYQFPTFDRSFLNTIFPWKIRGVSFVLLLAEFPLDGGELGTQELDVLFTTASIVFRSVLREALLFLWATTVERDLLLARLLTYSNVRIVYRGCQLSRARSMGGFRGRAYHGWWVNGIGIWRWSMWQRRHSFILVGTNRTKIDGTRLISSDLVMVIALNRG